MIKASVSNGQRRLCRVPIPNPSPIADGKHTEFREFAVKTPSHGARDLHAQTRVPLLPVAARCFHLPSFRTPRPKPGLSSMERGCPIALRDTHPGVRARKPSESKNIPLELLHDSQEEIKRRVPDHREKLPHFNHASM
ncbi:hypothetical protein ZHAS_00013114 [Anopheles sinensis]|uniref:Uncharacterized protein n=1 Tax=Anopheles sinensis TaxID=74873 RepID=A0A084W4L4_ANOSI|nr:hypothetical protein ZHAS_00013114 [Anopheles sinensis]